MSAWFHATGNGVRDASTTTRDSLAARRAGRVSTAITPMPVECAQCVARGVVDLAEDHHHEIGAPVGPQPGEHRDQPVGVVERDGGEAVDHVVTGVAADAEQLARAGDHLHLAAQAHESLGDRRRGLHGHLERLGVVRARCARRAPPRRATATAPRPGGS